jgi:hypothetical protein
MMENIQDEGRVHLSPKKRGFKWYRRKTGWQNYVSRVMSLSWRHPLASTHFVIMLNISGHSKIGILFEEKDAYRECLTEINRGLKSYHPYKDVSAGSSSNFFKGTHFISAIND